MYLKNTLRLFINNINLGFKAMLYRLIVMVVGLISAYYIAKIGISVITSSAELQQVIQDIKNLWLQFIGHEEAVINIEQSFTALVSLFNDNLFRIIGSLLAVTLVLLIMDYLLGLCNFALGVMIDSYMSSLTKTHFTQTFLQNLKKAIVFELVYSICKCFALVVIIAISVCFAVFTYKILGFASILIGLWLAISLASVFLSLTATFRPRVIRGEKLISPIKSQNVNKSNFFSIFAVYILSIVLVIYVNISMAIVTFGAGLMVSVPLTYLFLLCLQNVIDYSICGKKYYIDYDNIVVPKELRGEDERLLGEEVDI